MTALLELKLTLGSLKKNERSRGVARECYGSPPYDKGVVVVVVVVIVVVVN
jgi:hypothetical protein